MPRSVTKWYIYPLSSHTNARIAEMLDPHESMTKIRCADGEKRPVWECSREVVDMLRNSRSGAGFKFWVYKQEGDGRIARDMGRSKSKDKNKVLAHRFLKTVRRPKDTAS